MKSNGFFAVFAFLTTACAPLTLYYQEGQPVAKLNQDESACWIEALAVVPVNTQTRLVPGTKVPRTYCDAAGNCRTYWVQISPDRWETYDANEFIRVDYVTSCMVSKGYAQVRLPMCSSAIVDQTPISPTTVLPPLTKKSCAIRIKGGGWQVVTPSN